MKTMVVSVLVWDPQVREAELLVVSSKGMDQFNIFTRTFY